MNYETKVILMSFHVDRLNTWLCKAPPRDNLIKFHAKCLQYLAECNYPAYCVTCRDFLSSTNIIGVRKMFEIHPEETEKECKILNIKLRY